ncbi:MAG TPA: hypothetical protein VL201_05780 [Patescibacteria group bacterium]|nr:hypothetical protein [Patescibacteria group bacterium]
MKKFIFLLLTIFVSTSLMLKASLYRHLTAVMFYNNNYLLLKPYSTGTDINNKNMQNRKPNLVIEEPGVQENPEFQFKNLSLFEHVSPEGTKKTPLEKALTEQNNFAFDNALQKELNRINAELKDKK